MKDWMHSGKGVQINHLIHPLDPRGFQVFAIKEANEEEKTAPFSLAVLDKDSGEGKNCYF